MALETQGENTNQPAGVWFGALLGVQLVSRIVVSVWAFVSMDAAPEATPIASSYAGWQLFHRSNDPDVVALGTAVSLVIWLLCLRFASTALGRPAQPSAEGRGLAGWESDRVVLLALGVAGGMAGLASALRAVGIPLGWVNPSFEAVVRRSSGFPLVTLVLVAAVGAAASEYVRAWIQDAFAERLPRRESIGWTLVFVDLFRPGASVAGGALLGLTLSRTGRYGPGLIAHPIAVIVAALSLRTIPEDAASSTHALAAAAGLGAWLVAWFMARAASNAPPQDNATEPDGTGP